MKSIFKFSIVLMVLFSCKRDKQDVVGPGFISAPKGFAVTNFTAVDDTVNFVTDSAIFNATFTDVVTWILTFKGESSGATQEIRGTGSSMHATWIGTNNSITFFKAGEKVTATLSFFGTSTTSSTTIAIAKARNFSSYGQFPTVGDFENPLLVEPQPPLYSPFWASFNYPTPIPNESQGVDSAAIDYNGDPVPSVQGKKYYFIKGLGAQSQFVSGLQYFGPLNPILPSNADNIWVNIYIYGTGDANTSVDLEYQEDDYNGGNGYHPTVDDAWVTHLDINHKGWKLFSIKYTDLVQSSIAGQGDNGNHIREPQKLVSFDFVLLKKTNPNSPVEIYVDFPIITIGGPFDPSK
jgi:hypothetical protein